MSIEQNNYIESPNILDEAIKKEVIEPNKQELNNVESEIKINEFLKQISEAIQNNPELNKGYNEYKEFLQSGGNIEDVKYGPLQYNMFGALHYLTHGDIDEQNIKWVIRKYTTIFVESLGGKDTSFKNMKANGGKGEVYYEYVKLGDKEINVKKICDEGTAGEQIQFLKDIFKNIADSSTYEELNSGYDLDDIQSDINKIDENKLKMINIVDFIYNNESGETLAKELLNYVTKENNDVDTLLKDINLLNQFLNNVDFQAKYNQDYNNLEKTAKLQDELSLETLLGLSDDDKKEMIKLFLERATFMAGVSPITLYKKRKLIKWIDGSQDINVEILKKEDLEKLEGLEEKEQEEFKKEKKKELLAEYRGYIDIVLDTFDEETKEKEDGYRKYAVSNLPGLFEDLIWEEYGKALCGERKEGETITYEELKQAEANLSDIEKGQLMMAITRGAFNLFGIYYGQQYFTGTGIAEGLSDLTDKNKNIKSYSRKLGKRLSKLKGTEYYFELESMFKANYESKIVNEEKTKLDEEKTKLDEEKTKLDEEKTKLDEEKTFVNFMKSIMNGSTMSDEEWEKQNNFVQGYNESYPSYHDKNVSGLVEEFKKRYKNR